MCDLVFVPYLKNYAPIFFGCPSSNNVPSRSNPRICINLLNYIVHEGFVFVIMEKMKYKKLINEILMRLTKLKNHMCMKFKKQINEK
jgi:hypothetical protein